MQSQLLFCRELNLYILLKQFRQSSAKQGQNTYSLETPHFVVRCGTEFREAEQVEICVLPSILTLPKSHFHICNFLKSVIYRNRTSGFLQMRNAKLLPCILVCLCVPAQPTPPLPALHRKEGHAHAWREATACSSPRPAWTALGSGLTPGFLASEYKSAYRVPSLVWDYFPQIARDLSYFIANVCDLIAYFNTGANCSLTFCNVTYVSIHVKYLFPSTLNLNEKRFISLILQLQD